MAILGVSLLCNLEFNDLNYGDFLMLICSLFASFHIIYIGKVAPHVPSPVELNLIQNVFMGIMGVLLALVVKGPVHLHPLLDFKSHTFLGLMFLSLISSLIAFSIQVVAQKRIPSHIAGLIFLLESPFAALFGYLIFHEKLNMMSCIGAGLILLSVVLVPVLGREVTTPIKEGHPKKTKKT
jgi:drug/metabolite transporter (DMT)-like permease